MNNWEEVDYYPENSEQKAIRKKFDFKDFATALQFVNKVGALAEEANHHPDINLGWGYVHVWLTSHDEHKVTEKDYSLAKAIDGLV